MKPKRVILMYISETSGHHSATLAIEKAIKILSPKTEVLNINAFKYTNPISEKIVNRIYLSIISRTPRVWDYLYDNPMILKKIERIKDTIHKFNSPKLMRLFKKFSPDVVCCTQAFPCGMVADLKKTYALAIPLVAVLTDYVPHSYWIYDKINYYVTPSEEVSRRLNVKGVKEDKIKPLGIPFDPEFNQRLPKEEIRRRLGLKPELPTLLIMGGGQGLGPIKTIVNYLDKSRFEFQEIIVAGTNKKLFSYLKNLAKKSQRKIVIFGYINNIHEIMTVSDILLTKPGGITTAEALAMKIPMIILRPIPGQEQNNTLYLIEKKAAIKLDILKNISLVIDDLLSNPEKLQFLSDAAGSINKPNASLDIARLLLDLSERKIEMPELQRG